MSYNGSGTFNINSAGQPVVTGTVISSTAFNALTADLGTGLSTAITKDGQTVATARIPFAAGINSSLVTDATNTTTGSIITAGGVGIAKAVFVGTTLNVAGASTLAAITGTFNGTVGATTPSTGAFTTLSATQVFTSGVGTTNPSTPSNNAIYLTASGDATKYAGIYIDGSSSYGTFIGRVPAALSGTTDGFGYVTVAGGTPTLRALFTTTGLAVTGTLSATGDATIGSTASNGRIRFGNGTNTFIFGSQSGDAMSLGTGNTDRIVISSTGLAVTGTLSATWSAGGTSSDFYNSNASTPFGVTVNYTAAAPNGTSNQFYKGTDTGGTRFEVRSNGGIANYSANNVNLSDARVKKDLQPAGSYLAKICAIPVQTFFYKDQTDDEPNLGVIAQDVDAVAPELVDHSGFGTPPEGEQPYLAIYQTDLQYALMKCIQEQQALITALTTRIAALEAK